MPAPAILPFTADNLFQQLYTRQYLLTPNNGSSDWHIRYLMDYLGPEGLGATHLLIEPEYVSRDYLDGFSSYYALSFQAPQRNCRRLHFFNSPDSSDSFSATLMQAILHTDSQSDRFWHECYLGFIVVKPLAVCNIGYTVLKHYNYHFQRSSYKPTRRIWATREYICHIFGREIRLDSLAFQEQDANLAACASVAIWTVLQMAHHEASVPRKSPGQITRDSGLTAYNGNRLLPNGGLSVPQICTAITANGLLTEVRDFDPDKQGNFEMNRLRRLVDAYSGLKIPIILALKVPDDGQYYGHAVAIAGHETPPPKAFRQPVVDGSRPMVHRADVISKLYAHDDGWGCFARITFQKNKGLESAWNLGEVNPALPCLPLSLIISVPSKVRIPYEDVAAFLYFPDTLLKFFFDTAKRATVISWDIRLQYSEALKQHIAALPDWSSDPYDALKMAILQTNMPKYVWVATCYWNDRETINFVFDATEMKNGLLGRHIVFHGYDEQQFVQDQLSQITDEQLILWGVQDSSFVKYCLSFMREQCDEANRAAYIIPKHTFSET